MRLFLLIEPDAVVRLDLIGLIGASFKDDSFREFASFDGLNALSSKTVDANTVIIANGALVHDAAAMVFDVWSKRGARVILLGPPVSSAARGTILDQPFTSDMVVSAVLGQDASAHPPHSVIET